MQKLIFRKQQLMKVGKGAPTGRASFILAQTTNPSNTLHSSHKLLQETHSLRKLALGHSWQTLIGHETQAYMASAFSPLTLLHFNPEFDYLVQLVFVQRFPLLPGHHPLQELNHLHQSWLLALATQLCLPAQPHPEHQHQAAEPGQP